ncbi:MAG: PKD domain-containing protein, partial [Bacteroidota bacterium]
MKKYSVLFTVAIIIAFSYSKVKACNANFTHTNACVGDTITFYAVDQYAIYTWDFGDNTPYTVNLAHDTIAYHAYSQPGTYYVTLFANIGAEWDYQTQLITVGASCFDAGFTSHCVGYPFQNFYDQSIGNIISRQWNFGDPASGNNDTSTSANPQHIYSGAGTYPVTLIVSDGSQTDSITKNVTVNATCLYAIINTGLSDNCKNGSLYFGVYYAGYASSLASINWDFGDPSSGANNYSTDSVPSHVFSDTGIYVVRLAISDGTQFDTIYNYVKIIDCTVWPGDANRDGEVNMDDLLPLGMFYGTTGAARTNASLSWASQPATNWNTGFDFMYLQDLLDKKFADANGDGIIDSLDMDAITLNYGLHHNAHNNITGMTHPHANDPELQLQISSDSVQAGNFITIPVVIGSSAFPVSSFSGMSLFLNYDASMTEPGFTSVDFAGSIAGNLWSDILGASHIDEPNGIIDIGLILKHTTPLTNVYGTLATITLKIKNNASGAFHISYNGNSKVMTTLWSLNAEIFYPVKLINDSTYINTTTG